MLRDAQGRAARIDGWLRELGAIRSTGLITRARWGDGV